MEDANFVVCRERKRETNALAVFLSVMLGILLFFWLIRGDSAAVKSVALLSIFALWIVFLKTLYFARARVVTICPTGLRVREGKTEHAADEAWSDLEGLLESPDWDLSTSTLFFRSGRVYSFPCSVVMAVVRALLEREHVGHPLVVSAGQSGFIQLEDAGVPNTSSFIVKTRSYQFQKTREALYKRSCLVRRIGVAGGVFLWVAFFFWMQGIFGAIFGARGEAIALLSQLAGLTCFFGWMIWSSGFTRRDFIVFDQP